MKIDERRIYLLKMDLKSARENVALFKKEAAEKGNDTYTHALSYWQGKLDALMAVDRTIEFTKQ